jgi:hypothetical protein
VVKEGVQITTLEDIHKECEHDVQKLVSLLGLSEPEAWHVLMHYKWCAFGNLFRETFYRNA